jgi:uncharacterized protein (TIGR02145 family)
LEDQSQYSRLRQAQPPELNYVILHHCITVTQKNKTMKKLILTIICTALIINLSAQTSQGISHQAVIRNNENQPVVNSNIGIRITIIQGAVDGETVYVETHTALSNENSLITFEIGNGTVVSGKFSTIKWTHGPYFLKTEADPAGGTNYAISGTTQLLSVPYAYHASMITLTGVDGAKYGVGVDREGNLFTFLLEESPCPSVSDVDGNTYITAWINEQCWMAENLKTTKYRDDSSIDYPGTNNTAWENNTSGAYAWYNNETSNKDLYGALYNWYAITNAKGLCPEGWRVPSNEDWDELEDFVPGLNHLKGNKLKSCRQVNSPLGGDCDTELHPRWNAHGTHYGTDEYGFSGLPGGRRISNGAYHVTGSYGWWRTSTEISGNNYGKWLGSGSGSIGQQPNIPKNQGLSVRCIKNQ